MTGRRWLLTAFSVFIFLLVVWIVAAVLLNLVSAEGLPFDFGFRSRLGANYSPDNVSGPFGVFQFSIIGDALRDRGISPDDAEDQEENLMEGLNTPVPTATARDFHGEPPYTPTPTLTYTPTETYTPTSTPTPTPSRTPRPTRTPTRTRTQKPLPTNTPRPTNTPTPVDDKAPGIYGGTMNPPPGSLDTCYQDITVTQIHVIDPPISYGIQWVKLRYRVVGYSGFFESNPIVMVSGGSTRDGGWDAYYMGVITLEIDTDWDPPETGSFSIELWVRVLDEGLNESAVHLGDYAMPGSCAEE